jgi:hypothetical protein
MWLRTRPGPPPPRSWQRLQTSPGALPTDAAKIAVLARRRVRDNSRSTTRSRPEVPSSRRGSSSHCSPGIRRGWMCPRLLPTPELATTVAGTSRHHGPLPPLVIEYDHRAAVLFSNAGDRGIAHDGRHQARSAPLGYHDAGLCSSSGVLGVAVCSAWSVREPDCGRAAGCTTPVARSGGAASSLKDSVACRSRSFVGLHRRTAQRGSR